jgi:hypothetical protein
MNDEWSNKFKKLNFTLSYTIIEFFSDIDYPKVLNIPLEFKINLIDERIDYYSQYDDEHYYDFVSESKKIYEKYNFQCNNANKLLIYNANNCTFDKKLLHGGFECGDDGKWNITKCVPSYCDNGYIFDNNKKECVKDVCLARIKKIGFYFILAVVFFLLFFIILIIFIACSFFGGFTRKNYLLCPIALFLILFIVFLILYIVI